MIAVARADLRRMLARRGLILASALVPVAIVLVLAAVLIYVGEPCVARTGLALPWLMTDRVPESL